MVFFPLPYSVGDRVSDPEANGDKEERQDDTRSRCGDAEISRESSTVQVGRKTSTAFFTLCQKVRWCIAQEAAGQVPREPSPAFPPPSLAMEDWAPEDKEELDGVAYHGRFQQRQEREGGNKIITPLALTCPSTPSALYSDSDYQ